MEAERLRVTETGGVGGKGGSLHPGKRETERKRDRERRREREREKEKRRGEGCQLVWPVPKARGECSVQQTA